MGDLHVMGTTTEHQLAIDIGNTAIKAAVFCEGELIGKVVRFSSQEWQLADQLVTNHGVKNIIFSTVANVPPTKWMDKWNTSGRSVIALRPDLPLPFTSLYETMETLGQDRIAVVAGSLAATTFPAPAFAHKQGSEMRDPDEAKPDLGTATAKRSAKLIVDAGTCMTLDLIDGQAVYQGGNISPGLKMRLEAMHHFTAKLPFADPANTVGEVGRSTLQALRHGGQMGLVYEVEGLYQRLRSRYPDLELLLTGGDAGWLSEKLSVPFVFSPNLVLIGLHQILSYYVQNES